MMNEVFKALSDPTRREILKMLREKDLCAGDIWEAFQMSKPSITHHLNILTQSTLILREKRGQNVFYSLNTTVFQEAVQWFFEISKKRGEENE
jgi:ArsR family transcriptional regulator, arsenate/arsenite/antimonite-responsive transcriptional repressor